MGTDKNNNKEEFMYKKSLRPKEFHPMVPYCQDVFVAAGPAYVNALITHLEEIIKREEAEDNVDPTENNNGVILQTLKMVRDGDKLNDRYVMGATLYIIHSLIPAPEVIKTRVHELLGDEDAQENQE